MQLPNRWTYFFKDSPCRLCFSWLQTKYLSRISTSNKQVSNLLCASTVMSSSNKPKPGCFGSDIHILLLAAEVGQKANIMTHSSGHLGPHSLSQGQPHMDTKQSFWKMSQCQEETPSPVTLQQRRTKALTCVQKKALKACPSEVTAGITLVNSVSQDKATYHSSHAKRREVTSQSKIVHHLSSNLLLLQPTDFSHKVNPSSDVEGKRQSEQEPMKTNQRQMSG